MYEEEVLYIILIYVEFDRVEKNVKNPHPKMKITPPVSMLLVLGVPLSYIYHGHRIAYDPISRVQVGNTIIIHTIVASLIATVRLGTLPACQLASF